MRNNPHQAQRGSFVLLIESSISFFSEWTTTLNVLPVPGAGTVVSAVIGVMTSANIPVGLVATKSI